MRPREDSPRRADAVVVLSGSRVERLPKGLEIRRETGAPVLVISGGFDPKWTQALAYCRRRIRPSFRVICFTPRPDSTRGEVDGVARLAASNRWRSVVVVTSTYHVVRARLLFRRCLDEQIAAVGARPPVWRWLTGVFAEWGKLGYQLTLQRGC